VVPKGLVRGSKCPAPPPAATPRPSCRPRLASRPRRGGRGHATPRTESVLPHDGAGRCAALGGALLALALRRIAGRLHQSSRPPNGDIPGARRQARACFSWSRPGGTGFSLAARRPCRLPAEPVAPSQPPRPARGAPRVAHINPLRALGGAHDGGGAEAHDESLPGVTAGPPGRTLPAVFRPRLARRAVGGGQATAGSKRVHPRDAARKAAKAR